MYIETIAGLVLFVLVCLYINKLSATVYSETMPLPPEKKLRVHIPFATKVKIVPAVVITVV
jgi:hypothetical protein